MRACATVTDRNSIVVFCVCSKYVDPCPTAGLPVPFTGGENRLEQSNLQEVAQYSLAVNKVRPVKSPFFPSGSRFPHVESQNKHASVVLPTDRANQTREFLAFQCTQADTQSPALMAEAFNIHSIIPRQ